MIYTSVKHKIELHGYDLEVSLSWQISLAKCCNAILIICILIKGLMGFLQILISFNSINWEK